MGHALDEVLHVHTSFNAQLRQETLESLMIEVGLTPDFLTRYPHQLFWGQRQRVVIARAPRSTTQGVDL